MTFRCCGSTPQLDPTRTRLRRTHGPKLWRPGDPQLLSVGITPFPSTTKTGVFLSKFAHAYTFDERIPFCLGEPQHRTASTLRVTHQDMARTAVNKTDFNATVMA